MTAYQARTQSFVLRETGGDVSVDSAKPLAVHAHIHVCHFSGRRKNIHTGGSVSLPAGSLRLLIPGEPWREARAQRQRLVLLLNVLLDKHLLHRRVSLLIRLVHLHHALTKLRRAFGKAVSAALAEYPFTVGGLSRLLLEKFLLPAGFDLLLRGTSH